MLDVGTVSANTDDQVANSANIQPGVYNANTNPYGGWNANIGQDPLASSSNTDTPYVASTSSGLSPSLLSALGLGTGASAGSGNALSSAIGGGLTALQSAQTAKTPVTPGGRLPGSPLATGGVNQTVENIGQDLGTAKTIASAVSNLAGSSSALGGAAGELGQAAGIAAIPVDLYNFAENWQSGNTGADAINGAETGAAIGSAVPVIGTAIGAIGGAVVGALSSAFGGGELDPENASWDKFVPAYNGLNATEQQQMLSQLSPSTSFQLFAGVMDAKDPTSGHSEELEQVFGKGSENQIMTQMAQQINSAISTGKVAANSSASQLYSNVVTPWLQSKGVTVGMASPTEKGAIATGGGTEGAAMQGILTNLIGQWQSGALTSSTKVGVAGQTIGGLPTYGARPTATTAATAPVATATPRVNVPAQSAAGRFLARAEGGPIKPLNMNGGEDSPMVKLAKQYLKLKGCKGYADGGDVTDDSDDQSDSGADDSGNDNDQQPADASGNDSPAVQYQAPAATVNPQALQSQQDTVNAQRTAAAQKAQALAGSYLQSIMDITAGGVPLGQAKEAIDGVLNNAFIKANAGQANVNASASTQKEALANQGTDIQNQQQGQQLQQDAIKTKFTAQANDPNSAYSKAHVAAAQAQLKKLGAPPSVINNIAGMSAVQSDAALTAVLGQGKSAADIKNTVASTALTNAQVPGEQAKSAATVAGVNPYLKSQGMAPIGEFGGAGQSAAQTGASTTQGSGAAPQPMQGPQVQSPTGGGNDGLTVNPGSIFNPSDTGGSGMPAVVNAYAPNQTYSAQAQSNQQYIASLNAKAPDMQTAYSALSHMQDLLNDYKGPLGPGSQWMHYISNDYQAYSKYVNQWATAAGGSGSVLGLQTLAAGLPQLQNIGSKADLSEVIQQAKAVLQRNMMVARAGATSASNPNANAAGLNPSTLYGNLSSYYWTDKNGNVVASDTYGDSKSEKMRLTQDVLMGRKQGWTMQHSLAGED